MTTTPFDFATGEILLIDKPLGWTSFDCVGRIRGMLKLHFKLKLKVGHAGTLDPLATGLLVICTGKFTKRIDEFQAQEKEYTGTFIVGATTPSFDLEKEIDFHFPTEHISDEMIFDAAKKLTGTIQQSPPLFSAIKVDGLRSYKLARKGDDSVLPTREIVIREFEIRGIRRFVRSGGVENLIAVDFRVSCGKGTYIRSLARDFGIELNSGAYLSELKRIRIGEFKIENAMTMEELGMKAVGKPGVFLPRERKER
jgi:tRNA pseudouridine55 synthase